MEKIRHNGQEELQLGLQKLRRRQFWLGLFAAVQLPVFLCIWYIFFQNPHPSIQENFVPGLQAHPADMPDVPGTPHLVINYPLPDTITLFGEPVPLSRPDIRERLDLEMLVTIYRHSSTLLGLKRSPRYFSRFEKILAEEGLPSDFKYLAVAESNLGFVVSPAGAAGIWQFMPETGKQYGLEVNDKVDERYHVEKSTRAACRFLKNAHREFNSWINASASYNMGVAGLKKQIDFQKTNSYFDLRLNQETSRYVFRILAIKLIWSQPEAFGYPKAAITPYEEIPTRTLRITQPVNLVEWAKEQGTTYYMIRELNPWIRDYQLTPKAGSFYEVALPL